MFCFYKAIVIYISNKHEIDDDKHLNLKLLYFNDENSKVLLYLTLTVFVLSKLHDLVNCSYYYAYRRVIFYEKWRECCPGYKGKDCNTRKSTTLFLYYIIYNTFD